MSARFQRISPFLWFDQQAEEAARHYVSIFENSRIVKTVRYDAESAAASGQPKGSVMTVAFELDGLAFTAINGGPHFTFNESISLVVNCRSQAEIDRYWDALSEGGDPRAQQCGWLKDRYGLSWQVVSTEIIDILSGEDAGRASRAMAAVLQMKKIDVAAALRAAG
ncbi:VOC family protein [Dokdonella sp.]|uniref:VOC family protein n=1 Tax=Dokdonella sp. TaxID=2291710 RepID=UPI001B051F20|nr:VOC family protein [Dokdonella sp.]MBO9662563.1 VOC family protein [Dokdonella sp.]